MEWTTHKVRNAFLDYFKGKGHAIVPSAPIVIKDDPTLMFTNAGMNQFKSIFVGNEETKDKRVADTQKCLRVSGKHNDLEEVGRDHYHHTMFEMLGNWSFGDYFKQEAIDYAWDLLTNVYGIKKELLYVTVFGGDDELDLGMDEEARTLWQKHVPTERILPFGRKDNFWEMGETGPCGPCSEIHVDLRPDKEREQTDARSLVNQDHPQVIEIWNLVFMQFNRLENGALNVLKEKHIDTGMGLERLVRVLQHVDSNYDSDLFQALIRRVEEESGIAYTKGAELKDVAFRVIADHVRAIAFCIADGQLPSNTGAGYVVRRVLRRAIRYGFSQLNMTRPFIFQVAETLIKEMGQDFPELSRERALIGRVIQEEEQSFLTTLAKGLDRLEDVFNSGKDQKIDGQVAFELYDTFGFPIDLTQLIAEERGWGVDMEGFRSALEKQKDRSRNATKTSFGDWTVVSEDANSNFIGYDQLSCTTKVAKVRKAVVKGKETGQIVLMETPFYAESGGQVGDKGVLTIGEEIINVYDTKKENGEIIHYTDKIPKALRGEVKAEVSARLRNETKKNHTATHFLHHALRAVLGKHVEQKGSLVAPDRLRFDFSHYEKVSDEQLTLIERQVRHMISEDLDADIREMDIDAAKEAGAMALFGEKYGNRVRVVKFGPSIELCGGTHVENSSIVGGFKLLSESSVASGVRRVEALTGESYQAYVDQQLTLLDQVAQELGRPKDLLAAVEKLQLELKQTQKQLQDSHEKEKGQLKHSLQAKLRKASSYQWLIETLEGIDPKSAKDTVYSLTLDYPDLLALVMGHFEEKPYIIVGISKALAESGLFDAVKIIRILAPDIDGGGGGQRFLAMAGGKNKQGLQRALEHANEIIEHQAAS